MGDLDILTASMATSMASMGGFCTGEDQAVNHQRLSGSGYVFSASSPPYLSVASVAALDIIDEEGPTRIAQLSANTSRLHTTLTDAIRGHPYTKLISDKRSPLCIVSLPYNRESDELTQNLVNEMLSIGGWSQVFAQALGRGARSLAYDLL